MTALAARDGYRLWAPSYEAETAISFLEDQTVRELSGSLDVKTLLDAGCGTARRLSDGGARFGVGIDLSVEMLRAAREMQPVAAADLRALPFASQSFDVVWCRLAIGHLPDVSPCYAELGRVCSAGGRVVVSDICAEAIAAGHRRTFRDAEGEVREVEHFVHSKEAHVAAAGTAALELEMCADAAVGPAIEQFYVNAGRARAYERQLGQPLVRVMVWRKHAD